MIAKVSLGFARLSDGELDNFAQGVIDAITGNAAFPTPPVTLVNLQAAKNDFTSKLATAQTGSQADTAAKNNSRQNLLGMLREVASYVQIQCHNDLAVLLSSGFQAQNPNRVSVQLEKPEGLSVKRGMTGQLLVSVGPVKNVLMYEGRIKLDTGDWMPSAFSGDSRRIIFNGLSPGKTYVLQVRALGGATGQSDWTEPTSIMAA